LPAPLAIIIPVYNEADNIRATLAAIEQKVRTPHTIFIVYDFDGDTTLPVARELQKSGLPIELLRNPVRGVVNAIKTGLKTAPGEYLLVTMADMSDDYTVVDHMCELMSQGYDLVCGSRYMKGGRQIGGPVIKKTISRLVGLSLRLIARLPTRDVTNSFKMYRKSMVDGFTIESDGGFEVGMEMVVKAHFGGFKVTEVPCTWTDRTEGQSRFKIMKWAPKYLKWYWYAVKRAWLPSSKGAR
jgi:dolichol-phosphate mannosyltransferase